MIQELKPLLTWKLIYFHPLLFYLYVSPILVIYNLQPDRLDILRLCLVTMFLFSLNLLLINVFTYFP